MAVRVRVPLAALFSRTTIMVLFRKCYSLLIFLAIVTMLSCGTRKGYFSIEGRFLHINQGELYVYSPDGGIDGIDTIRIQAGRFAFCARGGVGVGADPGRVGGGRGREHLADVQADQ